MIIAWQPDTVTRDIDRAIHYTLLWGLEGLELRTIGQARVPHVSNEEKLRRRLVEAELPVVSVVPGLFEGTVSDRAAWLNDLAMLPETIAFCRRVGCPTILSSAFRQDGESGAEAAVEPFRRAADLAARRDLQIAILNEADSLAPDGRSLGSLLEMVDRENVRAAWDPYSALQASEVVDLGLRSILGRLAMVRATDGQREDGVWTPTAIGEGAVDWPFQLRVLAEHGFEGPLILELHAEPKKKHGVRDSTWLIRAWREALAASAQG